jgi:hypothetical protein
MLRDLLIAEASRPGASASLVWLAEIARGVTPRVLTAAHHQRIDAYAGGADDLHTLLPAVLPLAAPVWYETTVTAQHGTEMTFAYVAAPAADGLDVGWACYTPVHQRILGPLGPVRVTATEMTRPPGLSDESWRTLRSATGTVLRALLIGA